MAASTWVKDSGVSSLGDRGMTRYQAVNLFEGLPIDFARY